MEIALEILVNQYVSLYHEFYYIALKLNEIHIRGMLNNIIGTCTIDRGMTLLNVDKRKYEKYR